MGEIDVNIFITANQICAYDTIQKRTIPVKGWPVWKYKCSDDMQNVITSIKDYYNLDDFDDGEDIYTFDIVYFDTKMDTISYLVNSVRMANSINVLNGREIFSLHVCQRYNDDSIATWDIPIPNIRLDEQGDGIVFFDDSGIKKEREYYTQPIDGKTDSSGGVKIFFHSLDFWLFNCVKNPLSFKAH